MTVRSIGNYQITAELPRGSLGPVYLGRHRVEAMEVILRKVELEDCSAAARVQIKSRIRRASYVQSQLKHPGLARFVETFTLYGATYLVTEHVPGTTLEELLYRQGPPAAAQAVSLCRQALVTLDYLHNFQHLDEGDIPHFGVLHRDLKPSSLVLDASGRLRLTDLGVASLPDSPTSLYTGLQPGTLEYLAPELLRGGDPDVRTDIYSLGVAMYELLAGTHPYIRHGVSNRQDGGSGATMGARISFDSPATPLSDVRSDIDPALSHVLLRALERRAAARYSSAAAFLQVLGDYENQKVLNDSALRSDALLADRAEAKPIGWEQGGRPTREPMLSVAASRGEGSPGSLDEVLADKSGSRWRYWIGAIMLLLMGLMVLVWARYGLPSLPGDSGLRLEAGPVPASSPVTNGADGVGRYEPRIGESGGVRGEVDPARPQPSVIPNKLGNLANLANSGNSGNQVGSTGEGQAEGLSLRMEAAGKLAAAREADQAGNFAAALTLYEEYLGMGLVATEARDVAIYYEKLKSFTEHLRLAKTATEQRDYREARQRYIEALKLRPYSGFARNGLAEAESMLRRMVAPAATAPARPAGEARPPGAGELSQALLPTLPKLPILTEPLSGHRPDPPKLIQLTSRFSI